LGLQGLQSGVLSKMKTTLKKKLIPNAESSDSKEISDSYRNAIQYYKIFTPGDYVVYNLRNYIFIHISNGTILHIYVNGIYVLSTTAIRMIHDLNTTGIIIANDYNMTVKNFITQCGYTIGSDGNYHKILGINAYRRK
jgi:hypothetical protein